MNSLGAEGRARRVRPSAARTLIIHTRTRDIPIVLELHCDFYIAHANYAHGETIKDQHSVDQIDKTRSSPSYLPYCWNTGLPCGLHIRRTGQNPPRGPSAYLVGANDCKCSGTNGLTCLQKNGGPKLCERS
jgi:hypothetical protein